MNQKKTNKIKLKRRKAISLLREGSKHWHNGIYCSWDFELDRLIRNSLGYPPRGLGKEPFDYLEL